MPPDPPGDMPSTRLMPGGQWNYLLGRYQIKRVLGRGAMGEVLEAYDVQSETSYAIKRVPAEVALDPTAMQQIRQNFSLASHLAHPHIASLRFLQVDNETGHLYVVMDLVRGANLAEWIGVKRREMGDPSAPLPIELVLGIAEQAASPLDYAHSQPVARGPDGSTKVYGILHRDLKPGNVMVEEGREFRPGIPFVKLVDFGLAAEIQASLSGRSAIEIHNEVTGTPFFMAPEQFLGRALTRGLDQWALAVIIFEMAAGRLPFPGPTFELVKSQVLASDPEPPASLTPAQWTALKRTFQRDRRLRYPSCTALVKALANADSRTIGKVFSPEIEMPDELSGIVDTSQMAVPVPLEPPRKRPGGRIIAVAAILLAAAGLAVGLALNRPNRIAEQQEIPPLKQNAVPPLQPETPGTKPATKPVPKPDEPIPAVPSEVAKKEEVSLLPEPLQKKAEPVAVRLTADRVEACQGETVTLKTAVESGTQIIKSVALLVDGEESGVRGAAPYEFTWDTTKAEVREHTLSLRVRCEGEAKATANEVMVRVKERPVTVEEKRAQVRQRARELEKEEATQWGDLSAEEIAKEWAQIAKDADALQDNELRAKGQEGEARWVREGKFRAAHKKAVRLSDAYLAIEKLTDQQAALSEGKKAAREALELAVRQQDVDEMRKVASEWEGRERRLAEAVHRREATEELKVKREAVTAKLAGRRYEEAEQELQCLEAKTFGRIPLYQVLPEAHAEIAQLRREMGGKLAAELLGEGDGVAMLDEGKERLAVWALSLSGGPRERLPELYRLLMPKDAVLAVEFADLREARAGLEGFLKDADLGVLVNSKEYQDSGLLKKLKNAEGWFWENVRIFTLALPLGDAAQPLSSGNTVYVPRAEHRVKEAIATNAGQELTGNWGLFRRAWAILECDDLDRDKAARLACQKDAASRKARISPTTFWARREEACRKAGIKRKGGKEEESLVDQVSEFGLRIRVDKDRLWLDGRIRPREKSALQEQLRTPSQFYRLDTLKPISRRAIAVVSCSPQNVLLQYLLNAAVRGGFQPDPKQPEQDKQRQDKVLDSVTTLLRNCGPQITIALDQDAKGEESLVLVSAFTEDLHSLFSVTAQGMAAGKKMSEVLGLDTMGQIEEFDARHKEHQVKGFRFQYGDRQLQLLYVNAFDRLLIAVGGQPSQGRDKETVPPGLQESLDRMADPAGPALENEIRSTIRPWAGSFALLRPAMLPRKGGLEEDADPIFLYGAQTAGVSSFAFEMSSKSLWVLREGMCEYGRQSGGAEGKRQGSWLAPEIQRANRLFTVAGLKELQSPPSPHVTRAEVRQGKLAEPEAQFIQAALSLLVARTVDASGLIEKASQAFKGVLEAQRQERKAGDALLQIAEALYELNTGSASKAEELLRRTRLELATDPEAPAWQETLADLVLSQIRFKTEHGSQWALPYVRGAISIYEDVYGPPHDPGNVLHQLDVVALAWEARLRLHRVADELSMDDETAAVKNRVLDLLQRGFAESLGDAGRKLPGKIRSLFR